MKISMSEISGYQACRLRWSYESPNRRHLEPLGGEDVPLWLGSGVHSALEEFYTGRTTDPADTLLQWAARWSEENGGMSEDQLANVQLGAIMLRGYVGTYGQPDADSWGIKFLQATVDGQPCVEQQFIVDIAGTIDGTFVGTLDGMIQDSRGQYWVIDHKTARSFPDDRTMVLNQQFLGYTYAAQRLAQAGALQAYGVPKGATIAGVLYNGLRKQAPGPNVRTDLFRRIWVPHTLSELIDFQYRLSILHQEMRNPEAYLLPSPGWQCDRCAFKDPCIARQMGEDEDYILRVGYRVKQSRGEAYDPE